MLRSLIHAANLVKLLLAFFERSCFSALIACPDGTHFSPFRGSPSRNRFVNHLSTSQTGECPQTEGRCEAKERLITILRGLGPPK
jgi:hypothetical protein